MDGLHEMTLQRASTIEPQSIIRAAFAVDGDLDKLMTLSIERHTMTVEDVDMHLVGGELLFDLGDKRGMRDMVVADRLTVGPSGMAVDLRNTGIATLVRDLGERKHLEAAE